MSRKSPDLSSADRGMEGVCQNARLGSGRASRLYDGMYDGTVDVSVPRIDRWSKDPSNFDGIRNGDSVRIQMGGGMEKGKVISRRSDHITVSLGKRAIAVWDARSIRAS